MNAITPPARAAAGPLALRLGLRPADAEPFGGDVRLDYLRGRIFAQHRSGSGSRLGWECHQVTPGGRVAVTYTRGQPKGLVVAGAVGSGRLVLVEGALAALAARALLGPAEGEAWVVGIGGVWNRATEDHLLALAVRYGIRTVDVAISTHHPAGRANRTAALEGLAAAGLSAVDGPAPEGGWVEALRRHRAADLQQP